MRSFNNEKELMEFLATLASGAINLDAGENNFANPDKNRRPNNFGKNDNIGRGNPRVSINNENNFVKENTMHRIQYGDIVANIYEDANTVTIKMELAGFAVKDIDICLENGILAITAKREFGNTLTHREMDNYKRRAFRVPMFLSVEDFRTTYENGILAISFPAQPKKTNVGKISIL